eukprot:2238991-Lingulodinium_polyedra.AAC.1
MRHRAGRETARARRARVPHYVAQKRRNAHAITSLCDVSKRAAQRCGRHALRFNAAPRGTHARAP